MWMRKAVSQKKNKVGLTLIDVLVGTSLALIFFVGVFGAFQLASRVIGVSRAKIIATALANQKLEEARNLPYLKVGIEGVDEEGALKEIEYYPPDTKEYTIFTDVDCRNNLADGSEDTCLCDYKTVTVTVSWSGKFAGQVNLATDIAPKNEIQECAEKGGVLEVFVFDAKGEGVVDAQVQVTNTLTGFFEQCLTDSNGECTGEQGIFLDTSLEAENYKIVVQKPDYSTDQTFKSGDTYDSKVIANPEKPNATILEGQITQKSFSIDKLSTFSIETKSSRGKKSFDDDFNNLSKISDFANIVVTDGEVRLKKTDGTYFSSGFLISTDITSPNLQGWQEFSWIDSKPDSTEITYQLLYFDGNEWVLIPENDLPGNSTGLGPSPVDLSNLDHSLYDKLRIKATLSTTDPSQTPAILEWHLTYFTRVAQPVTASFYLRGEKIVGTDSEELPIYKYPKTLHTIDKSGDIANLEWDIYNFSDFTIDGESVDIEEGVPGEILPDGTLSVSLLPGTTQPLIVYLATGNILLVTVLDANTQEPIFSAEVTLKSETLGYEKTLLTNEKGEVTFLSLAEGTYILDVKAEGYEDFTPIEVTIPTTSPLEVYLNLEPE